MKMRPPHRFAFLASGLMLLTGACTASPGSDTQPDPALTKRCATILFVGVRGSGESANQQMAMGSTLFELYNRIRRDNPHTDITGYGMPYAANTIGKANTSDASTRLSRLLNNRSRRCPGERLIVAGYSLGAQIVGDAAQNPATTRLADHLAGIVILSDPRFNPRDTATATGTFDPRYGGTPPRAAFPAALAPKIHSYCRRHDQICQHGDPQANKSEHALYAPQQTCKAAKILETAARLQPARC
jgi:Cutinase